jgi:predicted amino acid racemase
LIEAKIMAYLEFNKRKLKHNYDLLDQIFKSRNIEWAVVSKLLCGHPELLQILIDCGAKEICDSRLSNLKTIKELDPSVNTVYIKPPAKEIIEDIIQYANSSFNTELDTIKLLSKEAKKQKTTHNVIIMIELGDLREGVMGEHLMDFYESIFDLPNIEVTGIGTNLNCLNGVLPSEDKLIQLSLYEQLIEAKFNRKIPWVTGGTSVIIPLLLREQVPSGINHFRIGESLFFGNNLITNEPIEGMHVDCIKLFAQIIEITEKPVVPIGYLGNNPSGESFVVKEEDYGKITTRAILDLGLLDTGVDFLTPKDKQLNIVGASSDMLVLDLNENSNNYKVGSIIEFELEYMGALRLFNSDYIEKKIVQD